MGSLPTLLLLLPQLCELLNIPLSTIEDGASSFAEFLVAVLEVSTAHSMAHHSTAETMPCRAALWR